MCPSGADREGRGGEQQRQGGPAPFCTDLDEEEGSVGGGVSTDVNASQDNGCHEQDRQCHTHGGAQGHRGTLGLGRQVVLETWGETVRAGRH